MFKVYNNNNVEIDSAPSFHVAARIVEDADRTNVKSGPHYCKPA